MEYVLLGLVVLSFPFIAIIALVKTVTLKERMHALESRFTALEARLAAGPIAATAANTQPAPEAAAPGRFSESDPVPEDIDPPGNDILRDPMLDRAVLDRAQRGNWTSALRLIASTRPTKSFVFEIGLSSAFTTPTGTVDGAAGCP